MSEATMGVIQHRFYNGFDWKGLLNKRIPPPYTPRLPKNGFDNIGYKDDGKSDAKDCKCKYMSYQLNMLVVSFSSYLICTLTHMSFRPFLLQTQTGTPDLSPPKEEKS